MKPPSNSHSPPWRKAGFRSRRQMAVSDHAFEEMHGKRSRPRATKTRQNAAARSPHRCLLQFRKFGGRACSRAADSVGRGDEAIGKRQAVSRCPEAGWLAKSNRWSARRASHRSDPSNTYRSVAAVCCRRQAHDDEGGIRPKPGSAAIFLVAEALTWHAQRARASHQPRQFLHWDDGLLQHSISFPACFTWPRSGHVGSAEFRGNEPIRVYHDGKAQEDQQAMRAGPVFRGGSRPPGSLRRRYE
jgi:hypothetical protein